MVPCVWKAWEICGATIWLPTSSSTTSSRPCARVSRCCCRQANAMRPCRCVRWSLRRCSSVNLASAPLRSASGSAAQVSATARKISPSSSPVSSPLRWKISRRSNASSTLPNVFGFSPASPTALRDDEFRQTLSLLIDGLVERYADAALALGFENGRLRVLARAGTDGSLNAESDRSSLPRSKRGVRFSMARCLKTGRSIPDRVRRPG